MNQFNNFNPAFGAINNPMQAAQQPVMEMNNLLTDEQIARLRQNGNQPSGYFFRAPTELDTLRAICTHKQNGQITAHPIGDGRFKCDICGEEFTLVDPDETQAADAACEKVNDIIQSIKTYYGQATPELAGVYPVINIIKQLPHMFRVAGNYMKSAMPQTNDFYGNNYYTPSNTYMNLTAGAGIPGFDNGGYYGGGYNGGYQQAQPYYNQGFQQPTPVMNNPQMQQRNQQPMYPQGGMPQAPAYGYPQQTQAQIQYQQPVQTFQPGYNPAAAQQAAPAYSAAANPIGNGVAVQPTTAPAANNGPTNTTNVNVGTKPVKFEA